MILFTKLSVNSPKTEPLLSGQRLAATYPFPESGCFKKSSLVSGFNSIDLICRNKTESPCSYWFTPAQLGRQQESCCRQTDYPREVPIPVADQKDRHLWERDCKVLSRNLSCSMYCVNKMTSQSNCHVLLVTRPQEHSVVMADEN